MHGEVQAAGAATATMPGPSARACVWNLSPIITYNFGCICADAQIQEIGWQGWACAGDNDEITVGTEGESLRMEALSLETYDGSVCADAHVQNLGWMGWVCGSQIMVGTVGRSLRMEAIAITVPD